MKQKKKRKFYLNIPISNHEDFHSQLKKMECTVTFQTKKIISFPEFSIKKYTEWNRTESSKKLK